MPHHRHAVDVEQELLRARHPRAPARGEDDAADRQQRRRKALKRRTRGADPFHLDAGADGDLGEIAKPPAVAVDEKKTASDERRQVGYLLRKTDHRQRTAVVARGQVLKRGVEVATAHHHRVRPVRLAICPASDGKVKVAHDED